MAVAPIDRFRGDAPSRSRVPGDRTLIISAQSRAVFGNNDGGRIGPPLSTRKIFRRSANRWRSFGSQCRYAGTGEAAFAATPLTEPAFINHSRGQTWKNVGLKDSRNRRADCRSEKRRRRAGAGAWTRVRSESERDFRTADGGQTWTKVLRQRLKHRRDRLVVRSTQSEHCVRSTLAGATGSRGFSSGGAGSGLFARKTNG